MIFEFSRLFRRGPATKSLAHGALVAIQTCGRAVWSARDPATLAHEGFRRNPVVHRAVRMVAEAAGGVPLVLAEGDRELVDHPLGRLLSRPNGLQGRAALVEALVSHLLIAGDAYLEAVSLDGAPRELHVLRPDRMRVIAGPDGWPEAYEYRLGSDVVKFDQRSEPAAPILHLKRPRRAR